MGALLTEQELAYVNEGLAKLGLKNLKEYYGHLLWICKRNGFAKRHPPRCKCGKRGGLSLHHKTYKNLGRELDEDLEWMCHDCHDRHHKHETFEILKQRNKVTENEYDEYVKNGGELAFQEWLGGRRYYNLPTNKHSVKLVGQ